VKMAQITRVALFAAAGFTVLALTGCITTVDVKQVKPNSGDHGLRYSLPATFLLVQPQSDGTASYSWVYLPDLDNTYAIQQHAYLSKFTLDVSIANGLLSKVNSQSDTTTIAAKLLDSAQSTFVAQKQANAAQSKAEKTSVASAQAAVASAQLALDQANAEVQALNNNSDATPAQRVTAALKVADSTIALAAAQASLASLKSGAADLPTKSPQQWGPVLFRVVQDKDGDVTLRAVNEQEPFDTAVAATAAPQQGPGTYKLTLNGPATFNSTQKPLQMTLSIDSKVNGVDMTSSVLTNNGLPVPNTIHWSIALNADGKSLAVQFPDGLPKGSYILTPAIIVNSGDPAVSKSSVAFQVE
jgi:hypothetical protein